MQFLHISVELVHFLYVFVQFLPLQLHLHSHVYKQFPGIQGELQGGFLGGFEVFFYQFSFKFPTENSLKNS